MSAVKILTNLILKKQIKKQTGIMKKILPGDKVNAEEKAKFALKKLQERANINTDKLTKSDLEFLAEDIVSPLKTAEKTVVKSADVIPFKFKRSFAEELADASKKGDFNRMSGIMKLDPKFKEVIKAFKKSKADEALADERALQTKLIPLDTIQYQSPEVQKLSPVEKLARTTLTEDQYKDVLKHGKTIDDVIYAQDFYGDKAEDVIKKITEKEKFPFADGGVAGLLGERVGFSGGGNGNGEDDGITGITMSIEERMEKIRKLLKQMQDIQKGKGIDPDPEDMAGGGRVPMFIGGKVSIKILNFLKDKKKIKEAYDNIFPTGDYKYDADAVAESLVENNPKIFKNRLYGDLTDAERFEVYGAALDESSTNFAKALQLKRAMRKASKPTKTLKSIEETGTINISDEGVADEFAKFMKETDPEGAKKIEQTLELSNFNPKGRRENASGGIAKLLGE